MKNIKFRVWDGETMMYAPSKDVSLSRFWRLIENTRRDYKVQQFTGLKDKRGKDIYEGDIIDYEDVDNITDSGIILIEWDKESAGWGIDGSAICAGEVMVLSKVIGNKYQNLELLL